MVYRPMAKYLLASYRHLLQVVVGGGIVVGGIVVVFMVFCCIVFVYIIAVVFVAIDLPGFGRTKLQSNIRDSSGNLTTITVIIILLIL